MKKINVTRTSLPPFEEYCSEIRQFWDSHILTNMGEEHEAFRSALERHLEVPHAVLFTNGHLALEAALAAFRLPAGAERMQRDDLRPQGRTSELGRDGGPLRGARSW